MTTMTFVFWLVGYALIFIVLEAGQINVLNLYKYNWGPKNYMSVRQQVYIFCEVLSTTIILLPKCILP